MYSIFDFRVAVGTPVAQRPPHRSARAVFLHAALTADAWRRSASRDTDEGFWGVEAIASQNQPCASTISGSSDCDVVSLAATVCSPQAENAGDWRNFRERRDS